MNSDVDILKLAKKKKRITSRDFGYWELEDLVHKGLLEKIFSKAYSGRSAGWPTYKLSRKGLRTLKRVLN